MGVEKVRRKEISRMPKETKQKKIDDLIVKAHLDRTYQGVYGLTRGKVIGSKSPNEFVQVRFENDYGFSVQIKWIKAIKLLKEIAKEPLGQAYNEFWSRARRG